MTLLTYKTKDRDKGIGDRGRFCVTALELVVGHRDRFRDSLDRTH